MIWWVAVVAVSLSCAIKSIHAILADWSHDRKCAVLFNDRHDCGRLGISREECQHQGCCWRPAPHSRHGVPWCFHPKSSLQPPYFVAGKDVDDNIILTHRDHGHDPASSRRLAMSIDKQVDILHVKIQDPDHLHAEVPHLLYKSTTGYPMPLSYWNDKGDDDSLLNVQVYEEPFNFKVTRNGERLFDTRARNEHDPFDSITFKNHFVEIGTRLPEDHYIYGLGERATSFRKVPMRMAFNARDSPAFENENTYGSHPFYMEMRPDGQAHGVLMLNSHPMEIELTENSLVYRMIGGIIDLYFFAGPTPDAVLEQYTRIIGRPLLIEPKFFGLHQCRFGYKTLEDWRQVVKGFEDNDLPLDGIWFDIDYMHDKDIFTLDPVRYPMDQVQDFIREQEAKGRFVVTIVDPGVTVKPGLPAYDTGIKKQVFLKHGHHEDYYEGKVWPGIVHFVDFLAPSSKRYWYKLIKKFYKMLPFAGLWPDMNEPASFRNDGHEHYPHPPNHGHYTLNYPPFAINNANREADIFVNTINMDARHQDGTRHLALHNVYGFGEALRTAQAMESMQPDQRHFLLTRSTFPGSGRFTAHWLGDNRSTWRDMKLSISGMLDFQLFGISMVGADICGFLGATDMELCARWMALGSFYPFARNHNAERDENIPQEPYRWPEVAAVTKKYFGLRYALLPYWYTLMWQAHETGRAMVRPMFFEFPQIPELFGLDEQFMLGSALLIVPVLEAGAVSVEYTLPTGIWFNIFDALDEKEFSIFDVLDEQDGEECIPLVAEETRHVKASVDLYSMPVLLRGGHTILKDSNPGLTIAGTQTSDFDLLVALDSEHKSNGVFYFDNGIDSNPSKVSIIEFSIEANEFGIDVKISGEHGYHIEQILKTMTILSPSRRDSDTKFTIHPSYTTDYKISGHKLAFTSLNIDINNDQSLRILYSK